MGVGMGDCMHVYVVVKPGYVCTGNVSYCVLLCPPACILIASCMYPCVIVVCTHVSSCMYPCVIVVCIHVSSCVSYTVYLHVILCLRCVMLCIPTYNLVCTCTQMSFCMYSCIILYFLAPINAYWRLLCIHTFQFAEYCEKIDLSMARDVFSRACSVHLSKKPSMHLAWAAFEERQG